MSDNTKTIVSMIAGEDKLTLITIKGELLDIANGDMYDTEKMVEVLTPKLTGLGGVEVDLDDFLIIKQALFPDDFANKGDIIVRVVDGKEIKGIFFPLKIEVAVKVDDQEIVIPEAQNLTNQMSRAIDQKSPAVANFMRRIAKVASERRHSAEDLMKFIQHCDLPLTDAGDIIAYKRVNKRGENYVDCHSGTVLQNVGYRVYTDVEKVDPDRSRACSNGLHVGSLSFMKSFYGGSTLVCLVKPEDFIAVPTYDTTKCRVCSYDIIGVLSDADRNSVNKGNHIKDSPFNTLIGNAVTGKTVPITHGVYVEGIGKTRVHKIGETPGYESTTPAEQPITDEEVAAKGASLESDSTAKARGTKVLEKAKAAKSGSVVEQARAMFDENQMEELQAFKKLKKKSWAVLGFTDSEVDQIMNPPQIEEEYCSECGAESDLDPCSECEDEINELLDQAEESPHGLVLDIVDDVIASKEPMTDLPKVPEPAPTGTVAEQAMALFKAEDWDTLLSFKKQKKKSWTALGFNKTQEKKILRMTARPG